MSTHHPALREVAGFRVLRELGRGGAGAVYLAVQEALDREVALKILHRDMAEDDVYLQRFFREAKAAAIFAHPNVVAVHDAGDDKATGDYYIAFEYIDGGSLEDLLQDGKLDEGRALEITKMIAQALFFAESKSLIHRDVKPANILIAKDGTAKLADLGLAKKTDPEAPKVTVEGLIVGTPYYMAPEQALGRVDIDNRVDIYALGLVLYCMLTGRTPYLETREENSTVIHVLSRRLTEELPNVNPRSRTLQRLLIGHATDLEPDANGRVLLPQKLREYAGLDKKLILVGQGKKVEIWSEPRWEARMEEWLSEDSVAELAGAEEFTGLSV